jgi:hypothetical protein
LKWPPGIDIEAHDAGERLIAGIADGLGVKYSKKLAFGEFRAQMIEAAKNATPHVVDSAAPPIAVVDPPPQEVDILVYLSKQKEAGEGRQLLYDIARPLSIKRNVAEVLLRRLEGRDLVGRSLSMGSGGTRYFLTGKGLEFLAARGLL